MGDDMKKIYQVLPMVVFLAFLAVMTLLLFLLPHKAYSENEKRNLAGFPEVSAQAIMEGDFQEDLETFTADQVPGRDFFVGVNAYWTYLTGRNAAQDIYKCEDDYLINAPKAYNEQIYLDNLTRFDQFAANAGVTADLIMVPSTGYIMEEVLPANHGTYYDDMLYEKAQETLQHVNIIDVRETLKEGAQTRQVCYKTDHHLTSRGFANRTVAFIENGSWAPVAAKVMKGLLEPCKGLYYEEDGVTIKSAFNDQSLEELRWLACQLTGGPDEIEEEW